MDVADTMDVVEWERRRAKFAQIRGERERRRGDSPPVASSPPGVELKALLDELALDPDIERFARAIARWKREPAFFLNGGRLLHLQTVLRRLDGDPAGAEVFLDCLRVPADPESAAIRIRRLVDLVERIRQGSQPSPAMTPLVQSNFWSLQSPTDWPVLWTDAEEFCSVLGWLAPSEDAAERYLAYRDMLRRLGQPLGGESADNIARRSGILSWYSNDRAFCGLDPSLVERCAENAAFIGQWAETGGYPTPENEERCGRNARALRGDLDIAGRALLKPIEEALGVPLRYGTQNLRLSGKSHRPYRAEGVAALMPRTSTEQGYFPPSARVWVTEVGTAVGIHCGWGTKRWYDARESSEGWYNAAARVAEERLPGELTFISIAPRHEGVGRLQPEGRQWPGGEFIVGRWFPDDSALGDREFGEEIVRVFATARPVMEALFELAGIGEVAEPEPEADELGGAAPDDIDAVATLADDLLLDRDFLEEIVALLRERGQIILYGPPGTGKTFVAKRLAEALAPEPERRMVVQFHPSTSYEDFFEGFRPQDGGDGGMRYALTPGPLRILADQARQSPGIEHVMVIDEINRGNLPRILGELLFLLEYRDESVRTLYRPDEPFVLPRNVLFIGTMNTADRSIALVDAALRRRFHFIPFFPHEGPLAALLGRWLAREGEPAWVADLVEMVNDELRDQLGGPHLQIGPSHFMVKGLDDARLRRIWDFNIFPFIEEQLYGDWDTIPRFKFPAVIQRFRRSTEGDDDTGIDPPAPPTTLDDA